MFHDDEDPVINEIPVYLSRELEDKLFVFQYPLNPGPVSKEVKIVNGQIKPNNQEVILDVEIETDNINYDKSHAEQISSYYDIDHEESIPSTCANTVKYESKKITDDLENYAVGTMVQGALILTPLKGAVSFSPSFTFMDSKNVNDLKGAEEEEAKMIRAKLPSSRPDHAKNEKRGYKYYSQKSADEPWHKIEYHDKESALTQVERERLSNAMTVGITSVFSSENYYESLVERSSSLNSTLTLEERLLHLIEKVKCVNTTSAAEVLGVSKKVILPCFLSLGVLVQGVWVLRSELRYKNNDYGVSTQHMINARDHLLLQYHEGHNIVRSNWISIVQLPYYTACEMLAEFSIKERRIWKFKMPKDELFITRHPEIVQQQNLQWKARYIQVMEFLSRKNFLEE